MTEHAYSTSNPDTVGAFKATKAGEQARKWLADHQPPDLRAVLAAHGLPRTSRLTRDGGYLISTPQVFLHEGTVWALYKGTPDGQCSWQPRKLSEFYAALEALEAVEQAAGVAA